MAETHSGSFLFDYWRDAYERSVLFLDVLRQRGNDNFIQSARTAPNVLNFEAELLVDGRTLPRAVNYGLVRIVPPAGVKIDDKKRPFIIFDPRAGHGPGIAGMKHDSEIGVALRAGHPCYFVGFLPMPVPGQTIEDVCLAEARFVEVVMERHREADGKPVLIGNCQAGWQIMMMAAMRPELPGPILVSGTPLSYWAGVHGKYPMRYLGGMLGGTWLTALSSDLGDGIFDGAYLIANFESNNLANTLWTKQYNVYSKVDTEAPRYLEFEKWWGSPVLLNGGEIQFIVDELFVGNRLAAGKIVLDGAPIDLRKIKSPIIVFCSFGDEITPPQQALDWLLDLYNDVDEMIANGQTVAYSLHPSIGHLGIFVSAKVAKKEYEEFTFNMNFIDVMPPGLYEIVLKEVDPTAANPELISGKYIAKLEPRTFEDIRALGCNDAADERRFATVARASEINKALYRNTLQPWVRAWSTPATAAFLRESHPNRFIFRVFSDHNPPMAPFAVAAEKIKANRHAVDPSNPLLVFEKIGSSWIVTYWEIFGKWREAMTEATFLTVYGSPWLQVAVGLWPWSETAAPPKAIEAPRASELIGAAMTRGGAIEAGLRMLIYVLEGEGADERHFAAIERLRNRDIEGQRIDMPKLRELIHTQGALLRADSTAALNAVDEMLPRETERREKLLATVYEVASAAGALDSDRVARFARVKEALGLARSPIDALSGPSKVA